VRDSTTGAIQAITVGSGVPSSLRSRPRHVAFSVAAAGRLVLLAADGIRSVAPCAEITGQDFSLDGRRLIVACTSGEVVVLDADTLAMVRRFSLAQSAGNFAVNADGTRMTVVEGSTLATYDVNSGVRVRMSSSLLDGYVPALIAGTTARRDALFVTLVRDTDLKPLLFPRPALLVDADTLSAIRVLPISDVTRALASPDGRVAVLSTLLIVNFSRSVSVIDLASNQAIGFVPSAGLSPEAIAASPLSPVDLHYRTDGTTVRLSWAMPLQSPLASSYVLEAGSRPGAADLASLRVDSSELTVPNVPRGTYFVRVKAANAIGISDSSAETAVVVAAASRR
jgi:hypothetical protein